MPEAIKHHCACPPGRCLAVESLLNGGQLDEFPLKDGPTVVDIEGVAIVIQNEETVLSARGTTPEGIRPFEVRCEHH